MTGQSVFVDILNYVFTHRAFTQAVMVVLPNCRYMTLWICGSIRQNNFLEYEIYLPA